MTISGTNFAAGATVTVGGTAATGVTVVNATTHHRDRPRRMRAGAVSVTVTNADSQCGTLASAFTYLAGPSGLERRTDLRSDRGRHGRHD